MENNNNSNNNDNNRNGNIDNKFIEAQGGMDDESASEDLEEVEKTLTEEVLSRCKIRRRGSSSEG